MIKITRWKPDTCHCVLHYAWDDSVPADQRVHTPVDIGGDGSPTHRCKNHINVQDINELHGSVLNENQAVNKTRNDAIIADPASMERLTDGVSVP